MLTLILGSVGMGKTTLARHLLVSRPKTIILDRKGEHHGDRITESLDDFLAVFDEPLPRRVSIVYRDRQDAGNYVPYLFEFLCDCQGWTIFIDEVDRYCSPHHIPQEFQNLINYRRHPPPGLELILVARRAAAIHNDLSALASKICMFHTHEPGDLKYIRDCVGKEYADRCSKLGYHRYLEADFPPEHRPPEKPQDNP